MIRCRVAALLLWALLAAPAAQAEVRVTDDRNRSISLQSPPQRVVSLLPSLTETLCALGACQRLVGTDRHSNWPAQVLALPKLGGLDDVQVERLVALRPDLVLAPKSGRVLDRLEALGLAVVALDSDTHADVQRSFTVVATLLGDPQRGSTAWQALRQRMAAAAARVPARLRGQAVYFEIGSTPYAAGPGSFIGQTLAELGLGNVVPAGLGPFPKLNPEFVLRHPPQVVMLGARDGATLAQRPGWAGLKAVRDAQVCAFDATRWDVLVRPGPRLGEAADLLADCLAGLPTQRSN